MVTIPTRHLLSLTVALAKSDETKKKARPQTRTRGWTLPLCTMGVGVRIDEEAVSLDGLSGIERQYYDDISDAQRNPQFLMRARAYEIEFVKEIWVFQKVPESRGVGKPNVSVKWVDVRGYAGKPEY